MAHINTRQLPKNGTFAKVSEVVQALRGAAADELSAANLYKEIIECFQGSGSQYTAICKRLEEILSDEQQHLGSLLWCIEQLDASIALDLEKGARGE